MEKLLFLPASRSKLEAVKAFLAALKNDFKSVSTDEQEKATITDPELVRRINDYEQGKTVPQPFNLEELKTILHA